MGFQELSVTLQKLLDSSYEGEVVKFVNHSLTYGYLLDSKSSQSSVALMSLGRTHAFLKSTKGDKGLQSNVRTKFSSLPGKFNDQYLMFCLAGERAGSKMLYGDYRLQ